MGNIHYHSRKLVRKYSLCTLWNIYYQEWIYSLYQKWKDRRQKSNTESNKDLTIGKSRSSQRASRFIDSSLIASSNFSVEEEQKEETPEAQSKLHIEESKINSRRETWTLSQVKWKKNSYTRQSWSKSIIIRSQVSIQKRWKAINPQRSKTGLLKAVCK